MAEADLLLDTGAGFSMITWNLAVDLGYNPAVEKGIPIITGNGTVVMPIIRLKAIVLGDISVQNILAICHDVPELSNCEGLLGLNFLKHVRTVIDFKELRLTID